MSAPRMTLVLGTAAGAFLAAGLTFVGYQPVAQESPADALADLRCPRTRPAVTLADGG